MRVTLSPRTVTVYSTAATGQARNGCIFLHTTANKAKLCNIINNYFEMLNLSIYLYSWKALVLVHYFFHFRVQANSLNLQRPLFHCPEVDPFQLSKLTQSSVLWVKRDAQQRGASVWNSTCCLDKLRRTQPLRKGGNIPSN